MNTTEIEILLKLLKHGQKFKGPGGKMYFGLQNKDFQNNDGKWKNGKKIFSDYKNRLLELKAIYKIKPKKAHSPCGLTPLGICYLAKYGKELTYSDVKKMIEYLQNHSKIRIPIDKLSKAIGKEKVVEFFQNNCKLMDLNDNKINFNIKQLPNLTVTMEKYAIEDNLIVVKDEDIFFEPLIHEDFLFKKLSEFLLRGFCFSIKDYHNYRVTKIEQSYEWQPPKIVVDELKVEEESLKPWSKIPREIVSHGFSFMIEIGHSVEKHRQVKSY